MLLRHLHQLQSRSPFAGFLSAENVVAATIIPAIEARFRALRFNIRNTATMETNA
jgi:hypothetical protein